MVDQAGRQLGPRALRTHGRLVECTDELLREVGFHELSVVDIAKQADTSPATFYSYVAAAAVVTQLEQISANYRLLERRAIDRADYVDTCAQLFCLAVTGKPAQHTGY